MANPSKVFIPQLAGEQIRHVFGCGWIPRPGGRAAVPAYVALTDTRLLVAVRWALFNRPRLTVDLGQIVQVNGGGLPPRLSVATTTGRIELSGVRSVDARAVRDAVATRRR